MPLYKRKAFPLSEKPKNLKPQDLVFQIRFTKEIFTDYSQYLKRLNFYRRKVWTCKFTGKSNLTYEEALVSELKASEKIQQFPKEFIVPVLHDVQFSMATLKDLANSIATKLQEPLLEGCELHAKRKNHIYPCKIVKVLEDNDVTQYEIAWLDKDKKITGNALVKLEDLTRNKLPFTREVLKSFIRESTYRNVPWVIHEELAKQHGISTDPPEELKDIISIQDGVVVTIKKRKKTEDSKDDKAGTRDIANKAEDQEQNGHSIKYPIEDLLVQPSNDDLSLSERPSTHSDFSVQMDCMGDFLMVWEFCTSFGRFLRLSPFSIEDFGNALCHKDSNPVLLTECHSALLRLLMKDNGEYFIILTKKKRKLKISLVTWSEYLCDFLEMSEGAELSSHCSTIRRGHYGLLDIPVKLRILMELVAKALESEVFREYMDECIDEQKAFAAAKRDEALEEGRKKREEKRLKVDQDNKAEVAGCGEESGRIKSDDPLDQNHSKQNQDVPKVQKKGSVSGKKHSPGNSDSEQGNTTSERNTKKQRTDMDVSMENANDKRAVHKLMKTEIKEVIENKNKEQRKEYLEREIEKRYVRTNPLGKDRDYNRYWFFQRDGRIFIESSDSMRWGYYCTKEELDAFLGSLNLKGVRERALKKQVEKYYAKICLGLQKRVKDTNQKTEVEDEAILRRSSRVRAPPKDNPALAFLKYTNKWRED